MYNVAIHLCQNRLSDIVEQNFYCSVFVLVLGWVLFIGSIREHLDIFLLTCRYIKLLFLNIQELINF